MRVGILPLSGAYIGLNGLVIAAQYWFSPNIGWRNCYANLVTMGMALLLMVTIALSDLLTNRVHVSRWLLFVAFVAMFSLLSTMFVALMIWYFAYHVGVT